MISRSLASAASNQAAVRMLCERGAHPRLAMRGTSMLPLLREPMVLELTRFTGAPARGDVIVFCEGDVFVAHRFIERLSDGTLLLAGDARPGSYDRIAPDRVIGTVQAVWSGPESDARRLDRSSYRVRGRLVAIRQLASMHVRRALRASAFAFARSNPRRRPRAYVALFNALTAITNGDAAALREHLASADVELLLALAVRHRCAPLLIDGIERLGIPDVLPGGVTNVLRKERWATATRTRALRRQLDQVIAICAGTGVVPVLLKGAARLYSEERDFDRYDSDDIDILVPRDRIDALTAGFHAAGYSHDASRSGYYATKHHTAPLSPPVTGVPVELHHALAPPRAVRARTDIESFAENIRFVDGAYGRVGLLDDVSGALHSAIHAREPTPLRNLVILAHQLRRLSEAEIAGLYAVANREHVERDRIHAALHAASRIAGIPSLANRAGRRHLAWRLRRFDLPFVLSRRSDATEWFVATSGRGVVHILRSFLPWENARERSVPPLVRASAYLMKLSLKPVIFAIGAAYALLMPEAPGEAHLVGLREPDTAGHET
jgi:hypothetical protein